MTLEQYDTWYRARYGRTTGILVVVVFMISDLVSTMLSFGASFFLVNLVNHHFINFRSFVTYWPFLPAFIVVFYVEHLYPGMSMAPAEEIRRFFLGSIIAHAGIILSIYVETHHAFTGVSVGLAVSMVLSTFFLATGRFLIRAIICRWSWWGMPSVIFGAGKTGRLVADRLLEDRRLG
jgi:FlaA1/EpsC-like NDP-sugar epimerase